MYTFDEWKSYYVEGRLRMKKGDPDAVDKINKQQLKVARDALKMYKE